MYRFRSDGTLQKFVSVQSRLHNYFNGERHLVSRQNFRDSRSAVLAEWRSEVVLVSRSKSFRFRIPHPPESETRLNAWAIGQC